VAFFGFFKMDFMDFYEISHLGNLQCSRLGFVMKQVAFVELRALDPCI